MTPDALILAADSALRTLLAEPRASRPTPAPATPSATLSEAERREAAALMRVNHVGEVCAQALYTGQMLASRDPGLQAQLAEASREETDHLAWTLAFKLSTTKATKLPLSAATVPPPAS